MGIAKIQFNGTTLIDLTNDTIDTSVVTESATAYSSTGDVIVGTASTDHSVENSLFTKAIAGPYTNNRITYLKHAALESCANLTSVDLTNVETMGTYAMAVSVALTSVSLPTVQGISNYCFYKDTALTYVNAPNATTIGEYAFYNCSALSSVNFSTYIQNTTSIASYAFHGCTNLPAAAYPKVSIIYPYGFYNCKQLTAVTTAEFPSLIKPLEGAFYNCSSVSVVNLPNATFAYDGTAKKYASSVFRGCTSLESFYAPKAIFEYSTDSFNGCSKLPYLILQNNAQMGASFAANCPLLQGVDMMHYNSGNTSGSQTGIGGTAFANDTNLTTVIIRYPWTVTTLTSTAFNNTPFASGSTGGTIYVWKRLLEAYKAASNWSVLAAEANNQFLPIEGSYYETHWVDGSDCNWWNYTWVPNDGLLSENGWTKTITGAASESIGQDGCILTSEGDSSGNQIVLRNTNLNKSKSIMTIEVYVTGYSTTTTSQNLCIDVGNGTHGLRLCLKNGYWYYNNSEQLCEALPNTTYKIDLGTMGSTGACALFIDDVQYKHKVRASTSYKNTQIISTNQAGYSSVIKSIKYKEMSR